MKKKNTLSVKPLRRYNTPVYPSYLDKNPIEHPDTLPYPFTYKALQALAAAGILVGASCSPTKQISDNSPDIQQETVQDSLVNPFTFERLGVPFMSAMFGTGMPERLKSNEARAVINKIFQEEGIDLEKNYYYKKDSIAVVLDGFNPDSNIGYVWVDWDKMGDGMVTNSWNPVQYEAILKQGFLNYNINQIHGIRRDIKNTVEQEEYIEKFGKRFETAENITSDEKKLLAYKEIYLDILIHNISKSEDRANAQLFQHITPLNSFQEKKDIYIKTMLLSRVKNKIENFEEETILMEIVDTILQLENEQEKAEQYNNFVAFVDIHRGNQWNKIENSRTQQILDLQNEEKIAPEIQVFAGNYLDKKLTLQEAKYLENIQDIGEDFIAPIGLRDYRFSYDYMRSRLTKEEKEKLRKIRETSTKEEYQQLSLEIIKVAEKRDPKDEALQRLETQVRQYIKWAKQQGGY